LNPRSFTFWLKTRAIQFLNFNLFKKVTPSTSTAPSSTSSSPCQNSPGFDSSCNYYALANPFNCFSSSVFLSGVLFSVACKKSCNLCNSGTQTSTVTTTRSTTRTSSTTKTTSSLDCVDTQSVCAQWTNYCYLLVTLNPNPCRLTCKQCIPGKTTTPLSTRTTTPSCEDSQSNCAFWANYCSSLVNVNPHPCRRTCHLC